MVTSFNKGSGILCNHALKYPEPEYPEPEVWGLQLYQKRKSDTGVVL